MPTTSPDNIYSTATTGPQDQAAWSQAMASSVQTALNSRQRYFYVWPNDAARLNQLNMTEGAVGYQIDTKTEYQYENSAWRLSVPYVEFTGNGVVRHQSVDPLSGVNGTFTVDATQSSSTTFATASTTPGVIVLTDPGIYSASSSVFMRTPSGATDPALGRTFLRLSASGSEINRISIQVGEDAGSTSMPSFRTTAPGQLLNWQIFQANSRDVTILSRIRITRLA